MKKLFSFLILTALVLTACSGGSNEVAATVDETSAVTVGDVEALIDPGQESTIPKERFAQLLGFHIRLIVTEDAAAEEFDISIAEEAIEAEAESIYIAAAEPDMSREEFLATSSITDQALLEIARQQLIISEVEKALESEVEDPAQEDVDARMQDAIDGLTEVCSRHVLVETEAEALEILDRLEAGEAFEDLATELSQDPGSAPDGGDLGCISAAVMIGNFAPEFTEVALDAEIDDVSDPVETQFGFHVILVYQRNDPAPEDLPTEQDIIDGIKDAELGQVVNDWFVGVMGDVTVEVNEKYGTWQTEPTPGVVPPVE